MKQDGSSQFLKISSAVFYGLSSFLITVINKRVLSAPFKFPSFLALSLGQLIATIVVLYAAKKLKVVTFPSCSNEVLRKIFPLPLIFLGNMMFGLGSTQALSLPMFSALRKISSLMTMCLEIYIFKVWPSKAIQLSIYSMIGGAILAASDDLSFNLEGYVFIMITNMLTSANYVFVKEKLSGSQLGTYGLMFYNSIVMLLPATALAWVLGDINKALDYDEWKNPLFVVEFIISCIMGFVLNYSMVLCTHHNSALTTTMVGALKSVTITYIGMFIGGDYIYSLINFIGINISVIASLVYSFITFRKKNPEKPETEQESLLSTDIEEV